MLILAQVERKKGSKPSMKTRQLRTKGKPQTSYLCLEDLRPKLLISNDDSLTSSRIAFYSFHQRIKKIENVEEIKDEETTI